MSRRELLYQAHPLKKIAGYRDDDRELNRNSGEQRNQRTVCFPERFCMLSVLLFVGRRCNGPILTLVEFWSFSRSLWGICTTQFISPRGHEPQWRLRDGSVNSTRRKYPPYNNRLSANERRRNHLEIRHAYTHAHKYRWQAARCVIEIR